MSHCILAGVCGRVFAHAACARGCISMSTLCLSSGHCANSRAHIRRVLESGGQSPHALLRSLETQLSGEKRVRGGVLERGGGGGGGLAAAKHSKVSWSGKFEELKQFWHRHGSANVTPNHPGLGGWSSRQRELFRQGRLASEHEALLRSLDFTIWPSNKVIHFRH